MIILLVFIVFLLFRFRHSFPTGLMYEMYELNLHVIGLANKKTLDLHSNPNVQAVFEHFGRIHREISDVLHVIRESEDE